jgi:hypothetical protein
MLSSEQAATLLADAIRDGRFASWFSKPIDVMITPPVSPSIGEGTPPEPIDDAEVERASRFLKRTSFKRGSKGWVGFMNRVERGY